MKALVLTLVAIVAAAVWAAAAGAPAAAAQPSPQPDGTTSRTIVELGDDAVVGPGEVADNAIAVGGDVIVAGVVRSNAIAVGGDVVLLPTAVVRNDVIAAGGRVERRPGAIVLGNVLTLRTGFVGSVARWSLFRPVLNPLQLGSLLGWLLSTVFYALLALVVAAVIPRQVEAVRLTIERRPWPSLGWGMLDALVIVPGVSVVLLLTVIGVVLLIPWLLAVVPAALLFGFVCTAAAAGGRALRLAGRQRPGVALCAVCGAVLIHLVRLVPYAGMVAWLVIWVVGFGAVSIVVWEWAQARRAARAADADGR